MDAGEAERWGFYNRVAEPPDLMEQAAALAQSLAEGPTFAHAMTKKALHQEWNMGIDEAIEAEAQTQALCMQTEDFVRAYRAFVNRSSPAFTGE
jgi:enoyl-CoA hydratase/carnithine racemase